jgi:anti-sigma-K factor RskA
MIPIDPEELSALAGEYVLGLLAPDEAREIEQALVANALLRRAVAFWEERLHPISALAPEAAPPPGTWDTISERIGGAGRAAQLPPWWNNAAPWRWATASLAAAAAILLVVVARPPSSPQYMAMLSAPDQKMPGILVMTGHQEIVAHAVSGAVPPGGRAFELWAIYPNVSRPQALGVIPANGILHVKDFPTTILQGASFAVSVEPMGGSPTGQPTGPVVYMGKLRAI